MSKRKSFVLRIDPETFKQIEKWADDEFRSVNGQIEWMMHKALKEAKRLPKKSNKEKEE
ncbi:Arc family DNA binding domain-containing protein [Dokdonia pacifica]|uniref:Arc family DNA binding domain-containing protein n=1 Tax=Dokdonia pacifica TaxID=1627892 RepID=UPI000B794122|nr:Arc family DNA binding domain-containing protein [Dokdonia pacifica]GGG40356.1 Arc family DNA binding domain-containing protein [Dokdonia pacifica]